MRHRAPNVRERSKAAASLVVAALMIITTSACDFEVTNPGPVPDRFLDNPEAHEALVTGATRDFAEAMGYMALTTGGVTREIHAGGNVCNYGITALQTVGILGGDDWEEYCSPIWNLSHRARWVAEDGIRRFEEVLEPTEFETDPNAAELLLLVGYSNRLLGENMCFAVIDGGPKQPSTVHLERAEAAFTRAAEIAAGLGLPHEETAAMAGRASVRVGLGDWDGALADAAMVPDGFVHAIEYQAAEPAQNNRLWRANANEPNRTHTVWNTVYEEYYPASGDPRTPWGSDPEQPYGDAAVGGYGQVPWLFQLKYDDPTSPIDVSSGREMRLIEAEASLRAGDVAAAMAILNERRASLGLAELEAETVDEGWTHLKRERGVELWIEARRLGDLRRWKEEGTPGELHPLEVTGGEIPLSPERSYCAPITDTEIRTNPNL